MKSLLPLLLTTLLVSTSVAADDGENAIKYRQAMMKAIGGHTGAAGQLVRGKVIMPGDLAMHTQALAALSANLPRLFPEGSDFGETAAKERIWEDWQAFEKAAAKSADATRAFADAVAGGDTTTIGTAYKQVGKACKGCHKDYRQKDDE